jgi:hypothetical protein
MTENNKDNIKKLIEQLQLIFSVKSGLKFEIYNNKKTLIELNINDINKINYKKIFNFKHFLEKDDINKSNIKRIINFSRNFLNNQLILFGIYDNNKPVLNIWIDYYELLYNSRIFDIIKENKKSINVFYINNDKDKDNNQQIFDCTDYYLKRWNSDIIYNKTILNENETDFKKNIKKYEEKCSNIDLIVSINKNNLDKNNLYEHILFILHNLKNNGNAIIKLNLFLFTDKIMIDIFYILYNNFEKIFFYKPSSKIFSDKFFIICYNYKKNLSSKDFYLLFKISNNINNFSIIDDYNKDYIFYFINFTTEIHEEYLKNINTLISFSKINLSDNDKQEIINQKQISCNKWIEYYIFGKSVL